MGRPLARARCGAASDAQAAAEDELATIARLEPLETRVMVLKLQRREAEAQLQLKEAQLQLQLKEAQLQLKEAQIQLKDKDIQLVQGRYEDRAAIMSARTVLEHFVAKVKEECGLHQKTTNSVLRELDTLPSTEAVDVLRAVAVQCAKDSSPSQTLTQLWRALSQRLHNSVLDVKAMTSATVLDEIQRCIAFQLSIRMALQSAPETDD